MLADRFLRFAPLIATLAVLCAWATVALQRWLRERRHAADPLPECPMGEECAIEITNAATHGPTAETRTEAVWKAGPCPVERGKPGGDVYKCRLLGRPVRPARWSDEARLAPQARRTTAV